MHHDYLKKYKGAFLILAFIFALFQVLGCSDGDDGAQGPQGPAGPPGSSVVDVTTQTPEALATITPTATVTGVSIASPPVVDFKVTDSYGRGIDGLKTFQDSDDRFFRFTMAKLVPGVSGNPDSWSGYLEPGDYDNEGVLVGKGNGLYTYTFAYDVGTDPDFDNTLTHRLGGQIGNSTSGLPAMNMVYDFLPAGGAVAATRNIAMTGSCNECHAPLVVHGRRFEVGYCVTCHNPDLVEDGDSYDMTVMVHKIHNADPDWREGFAAEVTYPQGIQNCRKCHNGADQGTPQGDNWKNKPSMTACGSCHTGVNFSDGTGHEGGVQTTNADCSTCHSAEAIENHHLTTNSTPNNPELPTGEAKITYELISVAVNGANQPVISFRILRDGAPLDLLNLDADLAGPGRWPDFSLAYALPQDGISTPAEYNNLGQSEGQAITVDMDQLGPVNNNDGTMVVSGNRIFTATPIVAFPANATMRAVAIQGYFEQDVDLDGSADFSLHTPSVVLAVTGDAARREVVDSAKCANCHEWFEGHGGSRVLNMNVCVFCHVPNLSSSGREIANPSASIVAILGPDVLLYPEATQNFKDMIHGIHASDARTTPFEHVRNRNNGIYYNWSEVTFPGNLSNCLTCHKEGTYELPLTDNSLMTTNRTSDGTDATPADVAAARDNVPNSTDLVISPSAATCYACHNSGQAVAHIRQNGGSINVQRDSVFDVETCAVCHSPGRSGDVKAVHGIK
ncbi:MAG: OmcA/MtrC family decaheme c-type cytochrome [Desulfosalsimonadaceae bacterium]